MRHLPGSCPVRAGLALALVACSAEEPKSDSASDDTGFSCGDEAEVCAAYEADSASFEVELPTERTVWWTEWKTDCVTSAEEARREWSLEDYWVSVPSPGLWYDFVWGEPYSRRFLDCAFVTETSFPYDIANDAGDEVAGLPVGWRFAPETEAWKVEELVLGIETSWEWRFGLECCEEGYRDLLYDWTTWEEDGVTFWRFCHVYASDPYSVLECHEYAYDPVGQVLGGLVTQGTQQLECFPIYAVDW